MPSSLFRGMRKHRHIGTLRCRQEGGIHSIIMVGIGRGAQSGVLIKNAEALERFEKVDTLVVDKTGTLTEGRPRVTAIRPVAGLSENELLTIAASLERGSEHPLAQAIVEAALERALPLREATDFDSPVGKGVRGLITPDEATAKRAYQARGAGIRSGALNGLFERDSKIIRPEVRALIDAELANRYPASGRREAPAQ
jgi:cation transport ATPase